jgi:uracil-DNA glycosylase
LWGNQAKQKKHLITNPNFYIIETSHPSPLGAYRGFLGSNCFSIINKALRLHTKTPINF